MVDVTAGGNDWEGGGWTPLSIPQMRKTARGYTGYSSAWRSRVRRLEGEGDLLHPLDGDKSPAESADKSAQSKAFGFGASPARTG